MNPEILDFRIRMFQGAKTLEQMADLAWQLAIDLANAEPSRVVEQVYTPRAAWISPMLAMAHKQLPIKTKQTTEKTLTVLHLGEALGNVSLPDLKVTKGRAEMEAIAQLLELDELVFVWHYMTSFFVKGDLGPCPNPKLTSLHLGWLPARCGSSQLQLFTAYQQRQKKDCYWWSIIEQFGETDEYS